MRLIVVVGARPNFIKVGPLIPRLREAGHEVGLAHTGQHYDALMSDVFFTDLAIEEPDWDLEVGSGTHAVQTGAAMTRLEELFMREEPEAVMVVGDVNSTLAGALAAAKLRIPVIHLEAGLRSFDMSMPEEVNRLVTDQLSNMLLTTTREAGDQLLRENVDEERIHFVGNIMAESVLRHAEEARRRTAHERFALEPGGYILATVHRPENTDAPEALEGIVAAFRAAPLPVLFPAHPRTRPALEELVSPGGEGLVLTDPIGYLDMLSLEDAAAAIVTDSGGVQEEACMLGTPCVTVRRNTERRVTIEAGANRLAHPDEEDILASLAEALASPTDWETPERWDERVAERVAEALGAGIQPMNGCA
jgi:UDP-N-acetylglucosamine 2-epimerase (non-hydrolysing)